MQTKYKILGTNFYSNSTKYCECYKIRTKEAKTNMSILELYDTKYKETIDSDFDTIVIEELDDIFISLNKTSHYAIFSKDNEDYNLLIALNTEDKYNEFLSNYNGDESKLILVEIIKDNVRGY